MTMETGRRVGRVDRAGGSGLAERMETGARVGRVGREGRVSSVGTSGLVVGQVPYW